MKQGFLNPYNHALQAFILRLFLVGLRTEVDRLRILRPLVNLTVWRNQNLTSLLN